MDSILLNQDMLYQLLANMNQKFSQQRLKKPPKHQQSFFSCCTCFAQSAYEECIVAENLQTERRKSSNCAFDNKKIANNRRIFLNAQKNRTLQNISAQLYQQQKDSIQARNNENYKVIPQRVQFSEPQDANIRRFSSFACHQNKINISPNLQQFQSFNNSHRSTVTFNYSKQIPNQNLLPPAFISARQGKTDTNPKNSSIIRFSHSSALSKLQSKPLSDISVDREVIQQSIAEPKQGSVPIKNEGGNASKKFNLQMRQVVSITQPQQQTIRQSVVIGRTQFYSNNSSIGNLKKISESEVQAESFIANMKNR